MLPPARELNIYRTNPTINYLYILKSKLLQFQIQSRLLPLLTHEMVMMERGRDRRLDESTEKIVGIFGFVDIWIFVIVGELKSTKKN